MNDESPAPKIKPLPPPPPRSYWPDTGTLSKAIAAIILLIVAGVAIYFIAGVMSSYSEILQNLAEEPQ